MSYSALAEECACWVGKATPMKEEEGVVQEEVEGQTVVFRADFSMKGKVEDTLTENLFEMEAEGNETGNLNTNSLKFFLAVCKAEVPEQQHCEPELSPGLGKVDPESTPMKEEQKELLISQDEEQLQELFEPKASIFTRHCVKSECKQEESLGKAILAEYPTLSRLTISEQQSFHGILDDHVTVSAAVEIFGAVEKTVAKYEEENSRLRTLLRISPEITPSQLDALRLSLEFSEKRMG
ncbi:hypothetical protein UPYG_G00141100 [Umbra pygmaea]|uniref:Uncharacterized protein n=1 Tax=Umbra pygmaea TaxID=75934 RepID=A0ABD0XI18_UMBPY